MIIDKNSLQALIEALRNDDYTVIGPAIDAGAIIYQEVDQLSDLPIGMGADQDAGRFRLKKREDDAVFGYTLGPTPWKRFLHPPRTLVFETDPQTMALSPPAPAPRYAFLGVRSCDLAAIQIYDRVMLGGEHVNERYAARRNNVFIVAVQCAESSKTCFCVSAKTGPRAADGFDLALSEFPDGRFLVEIGSEAGRQLMDGIQSTSASPANVDAAQAISQKVAAGMQRSLPANAAQVLRDSPEHPHWENIAQRCLTCGNCTMSCPTCFCTDTEDTVSLDGAVAQRWEEWASCFTIDYSHMAGGSVRNTNKSRYRQWLTHKLSTWHDQFGSSGCVGCGRCIVWCPVGIDLTAEVASLSGAST